MDVATEGDLYKIITHFLIAAALCGARLTAVLAILPFLSDRFMQGFVRSAVVLALSLVLIPMVLPTLPSGELTPMIVMPLVVKEAVIGTLIGFFASIPYWAIEGVGSVIDTQSGAAMASIFDPIASDNVSLLSSFFLRVSATLLFVTGGFLTLLGALFESYQLFPVFMVFPNFTPAFPWIMLGLFDKLMQLVVLCAAPVSIVLFFSEFGLGEMMNRFAPALNVFSLSMGIKSWLAILILVFYISILMNFFQGQNVTAPSLRAFLEAMLQRP